MSYKSFLEKVRKYKAPLLATSVLALLLCFRADLKRPPKQKTKNIELEQFSENGLVLNIFGPDHFIQDQRASVKIEIKKENSEPLGRTMVVYGAAKGRMRRVSEKRYVEDSDGDRNRYWGLLNPFDKSSTSEIGQLPDWAKNSKYDVWTSSIKTKKEDGYTAHRYDVDFVGNFAGTLEVFATEKKE